MLVVGAEFLLRFDIPVQYLRHRVLALGVFLSVLAELFIGVGSPSMVVPIQSVARTFLFGQVIV